MVNWRRPWPPTIVLATIGVLGLTAEHAPNRGPWTSTGSTSKVVPRHLSSHRMVVRS